MSNIPEPNNILNDRLNAIRDEFIADLGNRITAINKSWERARNNDTSYEQLNDFHLKVHNLLGSCVTFGITPLA